MALWETRELRRVLISLHRDDPVDLRWPWPPGARQCCFTGRHVRLEAIWDPLMTIVPLCLVLYVMDNAPARSHAQVAVAGFMGLSAILMTTLFVSEHWLRPVIRRLLEEGMPIAFHGFAGNEDPLPNDALLRSDDCRYGADDRRPGQSARHWTSSITRRRRPRPWRACGEHTVFIMGFAILLGLFLARMLLELDCQPSATDGQGHDDAWNGPLHGTAYGPRATTSSTCWRGSSTS